MVSRQSAKAKIMRSNPGNGNIGNNSARNGVSLTTAGLPSTKKLRKSVIMIS